MIAMSVGCAVMMWVVSGGSGGWHLGGDAAVKIGWREISFLVRRRDDVGEFIAAFFGSESDRGSSSR